MFFSWKCYAKKYFTVWENYYSIKSYSTFSAKMFQVPSFGCILYMINCIRYMGNTVDFLTYMIDTVRKKTQQNMTK